MFLSRNAKYYPPLFLLWLAAALFPGCADMPIVAPPPGEDQPIGSASIVLGPYLTSADEMQPFLRFVSNRRCVAGIQSLSSTQKYVNRQASFSLFHSLAIPELDASRAKSYRLLLDDRDGGTYAVKGLPRNGQATVIGFAGAGIDSGHLYRIGDALRALQPDATVFVTPPFPGGNPPNPSDWETLFFGPLGDKLTLGPIWFVPGANLPGELFPEHAEEGGYWKRDIGSVRIIGIDARSFSFESSLNAVLARLDRDLDPAHAQRPWTVVVLSRSAFGARVGDGRILRALGDRLESGGVDLVVGAGEYYLRTRPFGSYGGGQTRFISLSDNANPSIGGLAPREYVAAITGEAHIARLWADAGALEWQLFDLAGNPLDIITLDSRRPPLEPSLDKAAAVADAQAALTLQHEILRITRQAARAVPDPRRQMLVPLYFANPTTRRFSGRLEWDVPADSGWRIEPRTMPFDLTPGQSAAARFAVTPGLDSSLPVLTASGDDVGSSSERILITRERRYDVHPAPEPIRIDGRFRDKAYWKTLPVLAGFATERGENPPNPTEARITADQEGLIIALSMAAQRPSAVNPSAASPEEDRDGAILEDESVEIFIDPARRGRDYYRFAINPRNVVLDESSRAGLAFNPVWRHATRFGRVERTETWDVEMRIPWEALSLPGAPSADSEWGLQIVRHDHSSARREEQKRGRTPPPPVISQWVPTGGDNRRPGLYGVIRFGDLSTAPAAGDSGRAAPAPGFLIRGGGSQQLPGRLPGFLPPAPVPEPPPPDLE